MRILLCTSSAPIAPFNGLQLVVDALRRELGKQHDVRVLAFRSSDQQEPPPSDDLRLVRLPAPGPLARTAVLARASMRRRPYSADLLAHHLRGPLLEELARFRPDVVHVTGRLAGLGGDLAGRPTVLAALDARHRNTEAKALAASPLMRRLLRSEARRIRRFIATEYGRFGRVITVTDEDRDELLAIDPRLGVTVIPNGVDADRFRPRPDLPVDRGRLVFTGVMGYAPNAEAAALLACDVLPRVRARRPDAHLALVGRSPSAAVLSLGRLEGVSVIGEVPDLVPWIRGSRVYVCPMRSGTGIKNKLLEAMACGVSCVATPLAARGLAVEDGQQLLLASEPAELAGAVLRVLDDTALAGRLGAAARAYVVERHSWSAAARGYAQVYELVGGRGDAREATSWRS